MKHFDINKESKDTSQTMQSANGNTQKSDKPDVKKPSFFPSFDLMPTRAGHDGCKIPKKRRV